MQCEEKLTEAVQKRADLAFQDIPLRMNSSDDLMVNLEQCEKLFYDLRYVKSDIVKCFPPDFPVFEIYRSVYIAKILERIG
jgi:hypothetical protein